MSDKSLPQITMEVYELLKPLQSADRMRALNATLALLGESSQGLGEMSGRNSNGNDKEPTHGNDLGEKARRWMRQNQVSQTAIDHVFHIDGSSVVLIVTNVKGKSRREKTLNCYLMVGVRNLLANDEARFADKEAIEFCHLTDAYDKNNHTVNRNAIGNLVSGGRSTGFVLTVPGLRDAANLIKATAMEE